MRPTTRPSWRGRLIATAAATLVLVACTTGPGSTSPSPSPSPQGASARAAAVKVTLRFPAHVSNQVKRRATVTASSATPMPAGRLLVRQGDRTLASAAVTAGSRRSVVLTLPRLSVGKHYLYAVMRADGHRLGRSATLTVTSHSGCAWRPRSCGYPDSTNTGATTPKKLRSIPGDVRRGNGWHYDDRGWIT